MDEDGGYDIALRREVDATMIVLLILGILTTLQGWTLLVVTQIKQKTRSKVL